NTPERMSSGFQRTVIGLYSFGSRCRAARHGRLRAAGPSGPSGVPSIRGVENRQEILGNDHGNHVRKVRERPGTGGSAQASERRCEWEGATPFALIPRRGRIPLPLNPRIRAPHTIRYSPPGHQAQYSRRTKQTFLIPTKSTASGRVTRRASSDPACFLRENVLGLASREFSPGKPLPSTAERPVSRRLQRPQRGLPHVDGPLGGPS